MSRSKGRDSAQQRTPRKTKLTVGFITKIVPESKPFEITDTESDGLILRVQPTGTLTYYFRYRVDGRWRRYRIGPGGVRGTTPQVARDAAKDKLAEVVKGTDVQAAKEQARLAATSARLRTLEGFLTDKYEPWLASQNATKQDDLRRIRRLFGDWLPKSMTAITRWSLEKWRAEAVKGGKARSTVNRDLVALRSALSKAVEWGVIEKHPFDGLKPLAEDDAPNVRYLSDGENDALIDALERREARRRAERVSGNEWRRARGRSLYPDIPADAFTDHLMPMVLVSLHTGVRQGELFKLDWRNVNFDGRTLTIEGPTAKSRKTRHIPLNDTALEVLARWRKQEGESVSGLVFPGRDGNKPMNTIKTAWGKLLRDAGIVAFRWHDMRHDFAFKLVMAGVPLNTVRDLLGHSTLNMTLRYAHLAPDHKADAVALLSKQRGANVVTFPGRSKA